MRALLVCFLLGSAFLCSYLDAGESEQSQPSLYSSLDTSVREVEMLSKRYLTIVEAVMACKDDMDPDLWERILDLVEELVVTRDFHQMRMQHLATCNFLPPAGPRLKKSSVNYLQASIVWADAARTSLTRPGPQSNANVVEASKQLSQARSAVAAALMQILIDNKQSQASAPPL